MLPKETPFNGECLKVEKVDMKRLACINEELKPEKVKLEDVERLNKELKEMLEQSGKKAPEKGRSQSVERATSLQWLKPEKINLKNLARINKEFEDLPMDSETIMRYRKKVFNILNQKEEQTPLQEASEAETKSSEVDRNSNGAH